MTQFTQKKSMHMNGGSDFSILQYDVFADGEPTNITRTVKTNGRPEYTKTADIFRCNDQEFNVLETKGKGITAWLQSQLPSPPNTEGETK